MSRILVKLASGLTVAFTLLLGAGVAFGATLDDTAVVITGRVTGSRTNADVVIIASTARNLQIMRRIPFAPYEIELSPGGQHLILFVRAENTQFPQPGFLNLINGNSRLLSGLYLVPDLRWEPTGSRAIFISPGEGGSATYVVDAPARTVTPVFYGTWHGAALAPGGRTLAIITDDVVYSVRNDGTDFRTVTTINNQLTWQVWWSPDGQTLALHSTNPNAIYTVHADGSNLRNLSEGYEFEALSFPRWSPDGTHLAFSAVHQNRLVAYVVPVATGELIPIMEMPIFRDTRIIQVNWSRDSQSVGLLTASSRNDPHWYVVDRETGAVRFDVAGALPGPWSPDGSAFLYHVPDYTSPAYTTYATYLVAGDAEPRLIADDGSDMRWLPDGASLIYTRAQVVTAGSVRTELERRLYLLDLDGGGRYLTPPGIFVTDYTVLQD